MIDRIEELLAALAAEDEEERESSLALSVTGKDVPASPHGNEDEAGDGEAGDRSGGRTAEEIVLERPGLIAGETETASEREPAAGEIWKDGPVWTVRGADPETDEVQRSEAAEWRTQPEEAVPPQGGGTIWTGLGWAMGNGIAGLALEGMRRSEPARAGLEQAGLKGLYRQTVQGSRPAVPALPPEQAGRTGRVREPGSAASLAVDELDRAVRRDSRRYDGGMSIF